MACDCEGTIGCDCTIIAGGGIAITGRGTGGDPYRVENTRDMQVADTPSLDLTHIAGVVSGKVRLGPVLKVADTPTVDMTLSGAGTEESPFSLAAVIKGMILTGATQGQHLVYDAVVGWGPGPANPIPAAGAPMANNGIGGDGTAATPLRLKAKSYADWELVVDRAVGGT